MAKLLSLCTKRSPCPNGKIVKNLCSFVCCDPNKTPNVEFAANDQTEKEQVVDLESNDEIPSCTKMLGILTLLQMQRVTIIFLMSFP